MVTGIIGRKVGMTQVFDADGTVHPATVIKAGPCVVVQAKTAQTDGYEAVQLGFVEETAPKANKPTEGHFKRAGVPPTRVLREVRVGASEDGTNVGDKVLVDIFEPTPQTVDALMKLDLPAGVDVEIKAFGKEHTK